MYKEETPLHGYRMYQYTGTYLGEAVHEEKSSHNLHTIPTHLEHQTIGTCRNMHYVYQRK